MAESVVSSNPIVASSNPLGHFGEGDMTAGQQPFPGTCVTKQSTGLYSLFTPASGANEEIVIVREDHLQGKGSADQYLDIVANVTGAHIFYYIPQAGDELYMLVKDLPGTGSVTDTHTIGDLLMIESGSGKLIANVSGNMLFKCLQTLGPLTADTLMLVRFVG